MVYREMSALSGSLWTNIKNKRCGELMPIRQMYFLLLLSRQGKLRLQKWFTPVTEREKKVTREMTLMVLARPPHSCNFLLWRDLKIVYKRYASLYFCCGLEDQDNELLTLEVLQRYVELLDKYFGNVCELDIIFNFEKKAYFILDEFLVGGEILETSKTAVGIAMEEAETLQEVTHTQSLKCDTCPNISICFFCSLNRQWRSI
ncbi:AP-1 complex subunit sigma-2 isoform X2 [Oncorhynchus kisutch]|uniref:AP-1 complex subunit sigma-2 isoform X2 n=1 Tax=Oncorhynchus kisutch TaxID=8019 RepID=UPI0012DE623B|nr:AP-1 complex subunit sigma-2 isoform X2 [Oncorhynchus kisutch]